MKEKEKKRTTTGWYGKGGGVDGGGAEGGGVVGSRAETRQNTGRIKAIFRNTNRCKADCRSSCPGSPEYCRPILRYSSHLYLQP